MTISSNLKQKRLFWEWELHFLHFGLLMLSRVKQYQILEGDRLASSNIALQHFPESYLIPSESKREQTTKLIKYFRISLSKNIRIQITNQPFTNICTTKLITKYHLSCFLYLHKKLTNEDWNNCPWTKLTHTQDGNANANQRGKENVGSEADRRSAGQSPHWVFGRMG